MSDPTNGLLAATRYSFTSEGTPDVVWHVRRFSLVEGLSEPYRMTLELVTDDLSADPAKLLGGPCQLLIDREVTVRFDSNIDGALPWTVTPSKPVTDKIGTTTTINFVAVNNSDKPTTGQAIFNVQPDKAGLYFNKIECFCFTQQTLQPHQRVEMPVVFFVDPDMAKDHDLDYTRDITLSYTFYAENK